MADKQTVDNKYGIRIEIPDAPPEQQLKTVKELRETMLLFARVANEPFDTAPFDDVIATLENQLGEKS